MDISNVSNFFKIDRYITPDKRGKAECFAGAFLALAAIGLYAYSRQPSRTFRVMTGATLTAGVALAGHGVLQTKSEEKKVINKLFKDPNYSFYTLPTLKVDSEIAVVDLRKQMTAPIMLVNGDLFTYVAIRVEATRESYLAAQQKRYTESYLAQIKDEPLELKQLVLIRQTGSNEWKTVYTDFPALYLALTQACLISNN